MCSCVLEREKEMEVMHVWVCLCVGELFDSCRTACQRSASVFESKNGFLMSVAVILKAFVKIYLRL